MAAVTAKTARMISAKNIEGKRGPMNTRMAMVPATILTMAAAVWRGSSFKDHESIAEFAKRTVATFDAFRRIEWLHSVIAPTVK